MSLPLPVTCESLPECCEGSPRFYGQGRTYLSAQTGFLLTCPPGFSCDAGFYPVPITVPKGAIPFVPPPGQSPLRFTCCDGSIAVRYLPDGFTQAQFDAAAQAIADEAAAKLAQCKAAQYNEQHARRPTQCSILTTTPLADADLGTPYLHAIDQSGLTNPTWSVVAGSLPPGITLSAAGFLTGTPTVAGDYAFTIRASVATGSCSKSFNLRVNGCGEDTDWCTDPGTCRLRIKDFNAGDWTFAWDGNLPNKGTNFAFPCGGGYFDDTGFVGLTFNDVGVVWQLSILCPDLTTYLATLAGASPVGVYTIDGGSDPACSGPATFEIEGYTP